MGFSDFCTTTRFIRVSGQNFKRQKLTRGGQNPLVPTTGDWQGDRLFGILPPFSYMSRVWKPGFALLWGATQLPPNQEEVPPHPLLNTF